MKYKFKTYSIFITTFILLVFAIKLFSNNYNTILNDQDNSYVDLDKEYLNNNELETTSTNMDKPLDQFSAPVTTFDAPTIEQQEEIGAEIVEKTTWPVQGSIIMTFSTEELKYDEVLDQYRISNGVYIQTKQASVVAPMEGTITNVSYNSSSNSSITMRTNTGYDIILVGFFDSISAKVNDYVLINQKLANIDSTSGSSVVEVQVLKDGVFINPEEIIK